MPARSAILLTLTALGLAACGGSSDSPSGTTTGPSTPVASIALTPNAAGITIGATQTFSATPKDAQGNTLAGRTVTWSSSNSAVVTVSASGVATGVAAGAASIAAASEGQGSSAVIIVSGPPARLEKSSGDAQSATLGTALASPLVARVSDAGGTPAGGVTVTWSVLSGGGSVAAATSTTDANGEARMQWTLGASGGLQGVTASVANVGSVVFAATATVNMITTPDKLSAAATESCALAANGKLYCWGRNASGELADGTTTDPRPSPVVSASGYTFTTVAAGGGVTCGLVASGAAYCWGTNTNGQVGDNTTTPRTTPTAVAGGLSFTTIASYGVFTCGLIAGGKAYCWGQNGFGQLGDGTTTDRSAPVAVSTSLRFTQIALGEQHACGLVASGAVYCWGMGEYGQIGDGTSTRTNLLPVAVGGGLSFAAIAVGTYHSCGITSTGVAYCWGQGTNGQLGYGSMGNVALPIAVAGGHTFVQLRGGNSTCGLTPSGSAYCWGYSFQGQVGNGSALGDVPTPALVSGSLTFSALSSGPWHECGRTTDGKIYCWGAGVFGKLGDGTTNDHATPSLVGGGITF